MVVIKINGLPQHVIKEIVERSEEVVHQHISVEQIDNITKLCVDGSCTELTKNNVEVLSKLLHHVHESYADIIDLIISQGGF